jgi:hypothetical protein
MRLEKILNSRKYVDCVPVIQNAKIEILCDYCLVNNDLMDKHLAPNHFEGTVKLLNLFKEICSKIKDETQKNTSFVVNFNEGDEWTCSVYADVVDGKRVLFFDERLKDSA